MPTPQTALLAKLKAHQWYVHLSRVAGADLCKILTALKVFREGCKAQGVNLGVLFGPTLLKDLTDDIPDDFQPYPGYASKDGRVAKSTQEEMLLWVHSDRKRICQDTQYKFCTAVEGHMNLARETITWAYKSSLDLAGFISGTSKPEHDDQHHRAIVPDGHKGAGGTFCIAQRWVHNLGYFNGLSPDGQNQTFGYKMSTGVRLPHLKLRAHLGHVGSHRGETGGTSTPKRGELVRRATPYALHDGTVGLYFMGFCKSQAPMRQRMEAMYGLNGQAREAITDYSTPASGAFYFAPSVETLDKSLR